MQNKLFRLFLVLTLLCSYVPWNVAQTNHRPQDAFTNGPKQLYLPKEVWRVPNGNDYTSDDSEFSHSRKLESANIALFWAKEYGNDPTQCSDEKKRFDPQAVLEESERIYSYFTQKLKFIRDEGSLAHRYKLLIYIIGGDEGTAYGGGAEEKVGVIWTPAARIQQKPFAVMAHEMTHCLQYLVKCDGHYAYATPIAGSGSKGHAIFEMTAQYMLWQMYPTWIQFENYHLKGFLEKNHLAFLHEANMYHSPFVLEYWSHKHGQEFMGKLWAEAEKNEDPVMTYKRLTHIAQEQWNDEIFDAYRRFITWDMNRIQEVSKNYSHQHKSPKVVMHNSMHRVEKDQVLMDYGYHAYPLQLTKHVKNVDLRFEGLAADSLQSEAGWRYGFVISLADGNTVYTDIKRDVRGKISLKIPHGATHLWLVVSAAPKVHRVHTVDGNNENDRKWPYQFSLRGTILKN